MRTFNSQAVGSFMVLALFVSTIILLSLLYGTSQPRAPHFVGGAIILSVLWMVFAYRYQMKRYGFKSAITPTGLLFLSYFIVFFQVAALDLVDIQVLSRYRFFIWGGADVINKSLYYSAIGIISCIAGMYIVRFPVKTPQRPLKYSATFLTIGAYAFYLAFFLTSGAYKYGEYTPTDQLPINSHFDKLFNVFLTSAIILNICNIVNYSGDKLSILSYLKKFDLPVIGLLGWHLMFSLFVGDRGPIIAYCILVMGVYFLKYNKLSAIKLVAVFAVAALVMTEVGSARQQRNDSPSQNSTEFSYFEKKVIGENTIELAMSVRALNHSIASVPERYDYQYGLYLLQGVISIVPGISSPINYLLLEGDKKFYGSANFVSYLIQGDKPSYGDGTALLVDFYLDFGFIGIIVGMFLTGVLFSYGEALLSKNVLAPSIGVISILVLFSKSVYLSRSSLYLELSLIALTYIVILINMYIVKVSSGRGS